MRTGGRRVLDGIDDVAAVMGRGAFMGSSGVSGNGARPACISQSLKVLMVGCATFIEFRPGRISQSLKPTPAGE